VDPNVGLWAAQILLAALFGAYGGAKVAWTKAVLDQRMPWAEDYGDPLVKFIGWVEVAGAAGMILPMATGILPWLTPLAALGFLVIQVLAVGVHVRRNESVAYMPINLVLLALSLVVLGGRWGLFPWA
jgi:hypothetical protein